MYFDEEIDYLKNREEINNRELISKIQLDNIFGNYPNIPRDYLNYLSEVGAGNVMNSQFNIYNNLTDFSDLGLDDIYSLPDNVKLFGDNFSGDFAGFDLSKSETDEVVEFWHDSNEVYYTKKTFREYIREKILMPNT
ncbi:MAG: hypothetical protein RL311_558 [Bacteroidota bacterium]|jgi:hypothetical protein